MTPPIAFKSISRSSRFIGTKPAFADGDNACRRSTLVFPGNDPSTAGVGSFR
jgi:hypothetical protein